jgi:hypothetical protein
MKRKRKKKKTEILEGTRAAVGLMKLYHHYSKTLLILPLVVKSPAPQLHQTRNVEHSRSLSY